MVTDREKFALLLGINMAIMEMMFSIGYNTGQKPNREKMNDRVFEILKECSHEMGIKCNGKEFEDFIPLGYKFIIKSNEMCDKILGK